MKLNTIISYKSYDFYSVENINPFKISWIAFIISRVFSIVSVIKMFIQRRCTSILGYLIIYVTRRLLMIRECFISCLISREMYFIKRDFLNLKGFHDCSVWSIIFFFKLLLFYFKNAYFSLYFAISKVNEIFFQKIQLSICTITIRQWLQNFSI